MGPLYNSFDWPNHAQFLAYIEAQLFGSGSTSSTVDPEAVQSVIDATVASARREKREQYPNVVEGFPGVACSDSDNPNRYQTWPRAAAEAEANYGYFGRLWTHASVPCWNWPGVDRDRYNGRFTRRTANTVLIASTVYDPATRYRARSRCMTSFRSRRCSP